MITIKSNTSSAIINPLGAELKSFKNNSTEYIWKSDTKYWGKSFPVLFPNIGFLKNNKTIINGKSYNLSKHGFARENTFEITSVYDNSVTFSLQSNEDTVKAFPFTFILYITYTINDAGLSIHYVIENTSSAVMPYSFGLHPAFSCPISENETFEDYCLVFNKPETLSSPAIDATTGVIDVNNRTEYFKNETVFKLDYDMFKNDALVFEKINSDKITLQGNTKSIDVSFCGFSSLGLWTPVDAPFICIEPWCGMNDRTDENGIFEDKYGIEHLAPGEQKEYTLTLTPTEV